MNITSGSSWAIAATRGFIGALAVGMVAGLTAFSAASGIAHGTMQEAIIAGGVTGGISFFSVIATRLGYEGYLDRNNPPAP